MDDNGMILYSQGYDQSLNTATSSPHWMTDKIHRLSEGIKSFPTVASGYNRLRPTPQVCFFPFHTLEQSRARQSENLDGLRRRFILADIRISEERKGSIGS